MKKSLCVSWISNCDYPIFRQWLEEYHAWFDEIIIYWDLSFRFPIFSSFMQQAIYNSISSDFFSENKLIFLDPVPRDLSSDWRHSAAIEMLKYATGDWIVSIEQDWFSKDWQKLFTASEEAMRKSELFGWYNLTNYPYIHPAYWFIKRELLEKTSKDFSPHPEINGADHFSMITQDAMKLNAKILTLQDMGIEANVLQSSLIHSFHLGGVNHAYLNGLDDPNFKFHRGEIFYVYNYYSMKANVKQSPLFMDIMKKMDSKLKNIYPNIDPEKSEWQPFFQI